MENELQGIDLTAVNNIDEQYGFTQKESFKSLNSAEKSYYWQTRIENLLASDVLTKEQNVITKKLLELITPEVWEKAADRRFKNNLKEISQLMFSSFTKKEIIEYFVENAVSPTRGSQSTLGGCGCSQESDYCWFSKCDKECNAESDETGCGFLWSSPCDGNCNESGSDI